MTDMEFDKPCKLQETTVKLAADYDEGITTLARHTNLPYPWLIKFAHGEVANPSINRVVFLYEFLTGKPLEI